MAKLEQHRKVFGLGFSRTGTASFARSLNELGIKTIHFPCDQTTFDELRKGKYKLSILETYQGVVDIPLVPYYAQLDDIYPGSKFILTIREIDSWLKSVQSQWSLWRHRDPHKEFTDFVCACVYGTLEFNEHRFRYVYKVHFRNTLDYFANRPSDFLIMNISEGDGWEKLCPFLGLPIPDIPFPHENKLERTQKWIQELDLVIQDISAHTPAYLCRQISGIAVGWSRWDTQISERLEYYMARCARVLTSPSRKLAEDVAKQWCFDAATVRVVPNPIDHELFCPAEETADDDILLYVGRISRYKGVETLIEALPAILKAFPEIRVRLVGKDHGPDGMSMINHLRQRLRDLRVPEMTVEFVGPLEWSALPAVYRNAAVCVIPSFYESFSYTCVEAMASGCAVVASAVGAIPEIITDQVDGLLVPPSSPEALAAAVVHLMSDPALRRQLGMRARATTRDRFSTRVICEETERVYRSLLV